MRPQASSAVKSSTQIHLQIYKPLPMNPSWSLFALLSSFIGLSRICPHRYVHAVYFIHRPNDQTIHPSTANQNVHFITVERGRCSKWNKTLTIFATGRIKYLKHQLFSWHVREYLLCMTKTYKISTHTRFSHVDVDVDVDGKHSRTRYLSFVFQRVYVSNKPTKEK